MAERAADLGAQLAVLAPEDVRWTDRRMRAWVPLEPGQPDGAWVQRWQRLPDVFYENVFVHLAVRGVTGPLRRAAAARGIPLFNPLMGHKWTMHTWLLRAGLSACLPETHRLQDPVQAVQRIRAWGSAYIKPAGGYGGAGVTRVEALPNGRFRWRTDRPAKGRGPLAGEWTESALRRVLSARRRQLHLIQRGLDLLSLDGRKLDFRVVLARDGNGEWQVVGVIPKLAGQGGVVTNLVAGGERLGLPSCQAALARAGVTLPLASLQETARQVAAAVSRRWRHCGWLGLDMGIDTQGKVWLIEVNPKPARLLLDRDMQRQAARYLAAYAVHLAHRG